jgi:hypothetical protein
MTMAGIGWQLTLWGNQGGGISLFVLPEAQLIDPIGPYILNGLRQPACAGGAIAALQNHTPLSPLRIAGDSRR